MDVSEDDKVLKTQIRKAFWMHSQAKREVKRCERVIAELKAEKNSLRNTPPVKLLDEELLCAIKFCLQQMKPASKVFEYTANLFDKDTSWSKQIVRCRPLDKQIERVFCGLEMQSYEYRLIKEHDLLAKHDIKSTKTFAELFRILRSAFKIATKLEERAAKIKSLEDELGIKNREVESLKQSLEQSLSMTAKQRVFEIRRRFPRKNFSEIAEVANVSRQRVSKYLKQNETA